MPTNHNPPELLNRHQAAKRLGVHAETILLWIKDGTLPAVKAGDWSSAPWALRAEDVDRVAAQRDAQRELHQLVRTMSPEAAQRALRTLTRGSP